MRVAVGCDCYGYGLKLAVLRWLRDNGHEAIDVGAPSDQPDEDLCDYADAVCKAVLNGEAERGVLMCMTGGVMNMRANRHRGIRAGLCRAGVDARKLRELSNMNVMVMAGAYTSPHVGEHLMKSFIETEFEALERRVRRLERLDAAVEGGSHV